MKRDHAEARRARPLVFALFAVTVAPASTASGPVVPLQPSAAFHLAAADGPPAPLPGSRAETHAGSPGASADAGNLTGPADKPTYGATPAAGEWAVAATPDAATVMPPFRSALDRYRRYQADEPLRPWRELNDEVGAVGGHAGALGAKPAEAAAGDAREPTK